MRHNLFVTTAAAALLAGTVFAAAQGMQGPSSGGAGQPSQGQMQRGQEPRGMEQGQREQSAPSQRERSKGHAQGEREPKGKAQTSGQGQRDQGQVQSQEREQGKGSKSKEPTQTQREQNKQNEQTQRGQAQPQQGQSRDSAQQNQRQGASQSGGVTLTTEQKTKIRQTVIQGSSAPRVTNVNFSVSVGTVVPRDRVKVVAVPETIVEIRPAWRGYLYFIVNDEIVIVEPSSYRIVAVLVV